MAKLSSEEREKIRKYVLSLLVLPASVLTVLSFALGYFVNEGARATAYTKAYTVAQDTIVLLAAKASAAASEASASAAEAKATKEVVDSLRKQVEEIAEGAEEYHQKLKTVIAAEKQLADEVAKSLLKDTDFVSERVTSEFGTRLKNVEEIALSAAKSVKSQDIRLQNLEPISELEFYDCITTKYLNPMDGNLDFTCPDNTVIVGVYSRHSNKAEDRQFKFRYCKVRVKR